MTFEKALKMLPRCITGLDPLGHTTIDNLAGLVQLQIDLYYDGEASDITCKRQLTQCRRYVLELVRPSSRAKLFV